MTDLSGVDWHSELQQSRGQARTSAQANVSAFIDENPDHAARAIEIGTAAGMDPFTIYNNLPEFERMHKAMTAGAIAQQNPQIQNYVNSNPLASHVSNDDYANLDDVTQDIHKFLPEGYVTIMDMVHEGWKSITDIDELMAGRADAQLPAQFDDVVQSIMKNQGLSEDAAKVQAKSVMETQRRNVAISNVMYALPQIMFAPVFAEFKNIMNELSKQTGVEQSALEQAGMVAGAVLGLGGHRIAAGKKIPVGIDPTVDTLHKEQAKVDVKNLGKVLQSADKTNTKERSLDYFRQYVAQHGDLDMGITPEVVQELYGDKLPSKDDGLLGWVPGIEDAYRVALQDGTDIPVKLSDLTANIERDVFNEIKEGLRVRESGFTPEEAKTHPETKPAATPEEAEEQAAGMQPLFPMIEEQDPFIGVYRKKEGGTFAIIQDSMGNYIVRTERGDSRPGTADFVQRVIKDNAATRLDQEVPAPGEKKGVGPTPKPEEKAPPPTTKMKQEELPGILSVEDRRIMQHARDYGITEDSYRRYVRAMDAERQEKYEHDQKRITKEETKRQTKEWKENSKVEREKATRYVKSRPDVMALAYLRDGEIPGGGRRIRSEPIGMDYLNEDQQKAMPREMIAKDGINPDEIAGFFGFESGKEMIDKIIALEKQRHETGARPAEYVRKLIDAQTEFQMTSKYGELPGNILREIKDRLVLSSILERIQEETVLLGTKAGAELPLPNLKPQATIEFMKRKARTLNADKLLAATGRSTRKIIDALQKDDHTEAFRLEQRREFGAHEAKLAVKFEKDMEELEDTIKRLSKPDVKGLSKPYQYALQQIIKSIGKGTRLDLNYIIDALDTHGFKSLESFVDHVQREGYDPLVHDYIKTRPDALTQWEDMTVEQRYDIKDAIDSLEYIGREVEKITVGGEKRDFADWKRDVISRITSMPRQDPGFLNRWRFKADAELTRIEEIVKDLDSPTHEALGPLFDALIRPMAESKHHEYRAQERLSKRMQEIGKVGGGKEWIRSLKDRLPQDWFFDLDLGVPYDLTRQDAIGIAVNWGNRSNKEKFIDGHFGREHRDEYMGKMDKFLKDNLNKEDWQFAQDMWDIREEFVRKAADKVYRETSGIPPKWIPPEEVVTPHGTFKGGHWPIFYKEGVVLKAPDVDALFEAGFHRATPANHYVKTRTGFVGPVEFQGTIELMAARIQQEIHDISYREAVIQANKVIHDRDIMNAISGHYGDMYAKQFKPWLKSIANHFNSNEEAIKTMNGILRRIRFNLMGNALGLNLKVILSPDTGALNPVDVARVMARQDYYTDLAYQHSMEIPHTFKNMDRDFRERMEQSVRQKGLEAFQADVVRKSFLPLVKVSQGFRIVTWATEFERMKELGRSDYDAAASADSLVRERHGAAGLPDLSAVMRGSEGFKLTTLFYGFFNSMYNWQRQIPGQLRAQTYGKAMNTLYGSVLIPAAFGALLFNQRKEGESWWWTIGKALLLQPLQTVWLMRDAAEYFIEGISPRPSVLSLFQAVGSVVRDVEHYVKGESRKIEHPIKDVGGLVGMTTGLPMAQISRTLQFIYDLNYGSYKKQPRNFYEWIQGFITGEARPKK